MEIYLQGLDILYKYVYESEPIDFDSLSDEVVNYIKGFRPRLPASEFPEDYPNDEGYDGKHFSLYRGFCFRTEEEFTSFMASINSGTHQSSSISSWTLNANIAERFAKGAGLKEQIFSAGSKGIVLKATPIGVESTFFASYLAHGEFEYEFEDRIAQREHQKQHSKQEDEIVLLPESYQVSVYQVIKIV